MRALLLSELLHEHQGDHGGFWSNTSDINMNPLQAPECSPGSHHRRFYSCSREPFRFLLRTSRNMQTQTSRLHQDVTDSIEAKTRDRNRWKQNCLLLMLTGDISCYGDLKAGRSDGSLCGAQRSLEVRGDHCFLFSWETGRRFCPGCPGLVGVGVGSCDVGLTPSLPVLCRKRRSVCLCWRKSVLL